MSTNPRASVEITPEVLLRAYACGIFPMAENAHDPALYWIEPQQRGIIPIQDMQVHKRLARSIRQDQFEVRIDSDFAGVIAGCAARSEGRTSTWINGRIRELYGELFEMGHCHTVETWREGRLVGGLYGVHLRGAFFGESMFSTERDASKTALVHLVARLRHGGFTLLDTQFVTDHLRQFGAEEIERVDFQVRLDAALATDADFLRLPSQVPGRIALGIVLGGVQNEAEFPEA
jgi:leucyl/phenylalanyl-tRNA---protein transferase